jgi:hypothetical protein
MQRFMGTIKVIASFIGRALLTAWSEMRKRRRRAQNFRALSLRRTTQLSFVSKRLRLTRVLGRL